MHNELYADSAIRAPPYDMKQEDDDCTNDPSLFGNYTMIRCPDKRTSWIVMILLSFYVLFCNRTKKWKFRL